MAKTPPASAPPGPSGPDIRQLAARDVQLALAEDLGPGDRLAHLCPADEPARARIATNSRCVLAGVCWAEAALAATSGEQPWEISWMAPEGEQFEPGAVLAVITAPAQALLAAERTMLNFLQLLSATATGARRIAEAAGKTPVFDTRKTLPGLRPAQRHATRTGGMHNNRAGLYDAAIVKDNHIDAAGSVARAYELALQRNPAPLVQIEVADEHQLQEALDAGATRIMLDNWAPEDIAAQLASLGGRRSGVELEATGAIDVSNAAQYAATGVDRLSSGEPTRAPAAVDMSMVFEG